MLFCRRARGSSSQGEALSLFATTQACSTSGYRDAGGSTGATSASAICSATDRSAQGVRHVLAGDTATFSRWIRLELELGVGFQARYP
jgi:hypothetical protein